ncbi:MAG: rhomboid family intramembrane serine protease [Nitrococcus sp.]|nr:rhomboid family intramembrane serine protease [Nitrococcus sp.]
MRWPKYRLNTIELLRLGADRPSAIPPLVNLGLVITCFSVFLWQLTLNPLAREHAVYALGTIPATLVGSGQLPAEVTVIPPLLTPLTSMFLHKDWLHLLGNLFYLWVFGEHVEDSMGHLRYLVFYFAAGIVAVMTQAFPDPYSTNPVIGASGAISGVLGAYMLLFPRANVLALIPLGRLTQLIRLPAVLVLSLWFILQLLLAAGSESGTGFRAHIGGFIAGIALVPFFRRQGVPLWQ